MYNYKGRLIKFSKTVLHQISLFVQVQQKQAITAREENLKNNEI